MAVRPSGQRIDSAPFPQLDAAIAESTISGNRALRGGGIDVAAVARNDRKVLGDGTKVPLDGSPVIDVGSEGGMRTSIDQRGYPRVAGGGGPGGCVCDAGSVEKGSVLPPEPSVIEPVDG